MIPLHVTENQRRNLRTLLEQDLRWVGRARWARWLCHGDLDDTVAIAAMSRDARLAARAWVLQQRHGLHATVEGYAHGADGSRAPDGWAEALPLCRALSH
ncbi:MAG: hypothetical protein ACI9OB_000438 [Nonlabens sp.]